MNAFGQSEEKFEELWDRSVYQGTFNTSNFAWFKLVFNQRYPSVRWALQNFSTRANACLFSWNKWEVERRPCQNARRLANDVLSHVKLTKAKRDVQKIKKEVSSWLNTFFKDTKRILVESGLRHDFWNEYSESFVADVFAGSSLTEMLEFSELDWKDQVLPFLEKITNIICGNLCSLVATQVFTSYVDALRLFDGKILFKLEWSPSSKLCSWRSLNYTSFICFIISIRILYDKVFYC